MAFILVIFLVIVNRPDGPSPSDRQRPVPTTRAPRTTPPPTRRALPPPPVTAVAPVNRPALTGPAEDTTAIVASLLAVCLSGFAVAAFRRR
jgi:hypothetical protein